MKIKDIAQAAGVSTATVSNVINGNYHKVSRATVEKVQKIVETMGYSPSATARSLASKKSRIIGVVVPNIGDGESFYSNPHYAQLLALLEVDIRNRDYYMMMRCVKRSKDVIPLFSSWNVDGILFIGTFRSEVEEIKSQLKVPAVFIDTYAEDLGIVNVGIDDYKGGYLSGSYLIEKGHRRIALAAPGIRDQSVMQMRYEGFRDACRERGVELTEKDFFKANTVYRSGVEAGQRIAQSGIDYTAVAVMSDIAAFGVMEGLRLGGKQVPEEVSVIGFDDLWECRYTYPKLTTISQDIPEKAGRASRLLFDMIQGLEAPETCEKQDVKVVQRQSVRDLTR